MKGIINEIMEIYNNLDADKQNKLDKLFQEVYNMGGIYVCTQMSTFNKLAVEN